MTGALPHSSSRCFSSSGVLLGCAALTVDVGQLYSERRQLQNGADAAALALAKVCASGGTCSYAGADAAALGANRISNLNNVNAKDNAAAFNTTFNGTYDTGLCGRATALPNCAAPNGSLLDCPTRPVVAHGEHRHPVRGGAQPDPNQLRQLHPSHCLRTSRDRILRRGGLLLLSRRLGITWWSWDRAISRSPCRDVTGCTPRGARSVVAVVRITRRRSTELQAVRSTATAAPGSPRGQTRRLPRRRRSLVTRSSCWSRTRLVEGPCQRPARRGRATHFRVASGFSTPFLPTRASPSRTRSTGCTRRPVTILVATSTTWSAR